MWRLLKGTACSSCASEGLVVTAAAYAGGRSGLRCRTRCRWTTQYQGRTRRGVQVELGPPAPRASRTRVRVAPFGTCDRCEAAGKRTLGKPAAVGRVQVATSR